MKPTTVATAITLICLALVAPMHAQVTIGIAEEPAQGALLQLKDIATAAGSKNAKKGLLMPRVSLTSDSTLAPMLPNASEGEMQKHAGLIVYNLTEQDPLTKGIMMWNGKSWLRIKAKDMDTDPEVKKTLYISRKPLPDHTVAVKSLEVSMAIAGMEFEVVPRFRVTAPYMPAAGATKKYLYQIMRYWTGESHKIPNGEFSADLYQASFTQSNYADHQQFRAGYMTTQEKDEVWLLDDDTDDVFHIQFFELGTNFPEEDRQHAILVKRF